MRAIVVANERCGATPRAISEALRAHGVDGEVRVAPGSRLAETAAAALGQADVVVAAGGDGTVSAVAGALAGRGVPLGVLPLGTLNHFAKDLDLPRELDGAARTLASGAVRRVDVGLVNGRLFLNNSSLGVYPHMVSERERLEHVHGFTKWLAMARAGIGVLRDPPLYRGELRTAAGRLRLRTAFVFVGNNVYDLAGGRPATRGALDGGRLHVWASAAGSGAALVRQAALGYLGLAERDPHLETLETPEAELVLGRRPVRVSLDGEVVVVQPPLRYRVRPGALAVVVPP